VNAIRNQNAALQSNRGLQFHSTDNDHIICYSKRTEDNSNVIVTAVNLDAVWSQSGHVQLPLQEFGIDSRYPYQVIDLLTDRSFTWYGPRNYIELRPNEMPAHILKIERFEAYAGTA
jgi:starch synthase (maltosyl-transferring)